MADQAQILILQNAPFCLRQRTMADQAQILILKILYVFLWLKFSPSLNLNKIEHFSKVSGFGRWQELAGGTFCI